MPLIWSIAWMDLLWTCRNCFNFLFVRDHRCRTNASDLYERHPAWQSDWDVLLQYHSCPHIFRRRKCPVCRFYACDFGNGIYASRITQPSSWFVRILLLGVRIFDITLVVMSRLKRGDPFYKAGEDHVYHQLIEWGNVIRSGSDNDAYCRFVNRSPCIYCFASAASAGKYSFWSVVLCGSIALIILQKKK